MCSKKSTSLPPFLNPWVRSRLLKGVRVWQEERILWGGILEVCRSRCVFRVDGVGGPCPLTSSLVRKESQSGFLNDFVWDVSMGVDGRSEWAGVWLPRRISIEWEMVWKTVLAKNWEICCWTPRGKWCDCFPRTRAGQKEGRDGWDRPRAYPRVQTDPSSYKL